MLDGWDYLNYISVFTCTTDCGSDETKVRTDYIAYALAPVPWAWYFQVMCMLHQMHIIMRMLLVHTDVFFEVLGITLYTTKYFTTLNAMADDKSSADNPIVPATT